MIFKINIDNIKIAFFFLQFSIAIFSSLLNTNMFFSTIFALYIFFIAFNINIIKINAKLVFIFVVVFVYISIKERIISNFKSIKIIDSRTLSFYVGAGNLVRLYILIDTT